ncbi:MAG: glycerol-3-phosphate acyltransferase, partial [Planifilum sp.]
GEPALLMATGVAAIVGHNWPVFLKFRGGKGIATTIGVTALLTFQAALVSGIFAVLAILLTRYVSLGSLVFTTLLPILIGWMDYPPAYFWISLIITLLAYLRHRDNIKRLLQGKEHRIGIRK